MLVVSARAEHTAHENQRNVRVVVVRSSVCRYGGSPDPVGFQNHFQITRPLRMETGNHSLIDSVNRCTATRELVPRIDTKDMGSSQHSGSGRASYLRGIEFSRVDERVVQI